MLTTMFVSVVDSIRSKHFFGLAEWEISVLAELPGKFAEMAPIFKNVTVEYEQLGEQVL